MNHRRRDLRPYLSFSLLMLIFPTGKFSPLRQVNEQSVFQVRVSIYEVPWMIISRTIASTTNADGSVSGRMVGGITTASVPAGTVLLENRLSGSHSVASVRRAIRKYMSNGCVRDQDITVFELAQHDFSFDGKCLELREIGREAKSIRHDLNYHVRIEPAWKTDEEVGLALQLWMHTENRYGVRVIGDQNPELQVLDHTIASKFGHISLLAFRSANESWSGSVYWLAISAEKL